MAVLLLVVAVSVASCNNGPGSEDEALRVNLWASVEELTGVDWPTDADGQLREPLFIEDPHTIEIEIGESRPFVAESQLTFLVQDSGELVDVAIQPPPAPRDFAPTLDDLEVLLDRNGVLADEAVAELAAWRAAGEPVAEWPASPRLSFRTQLAQASMFVEARKLDDDGWYYTISFSRPVELWPSLQDLDSDG